jgi:hypothetical protein
MIYLMVSSKSIFVPLLILFNVFLFFGMIYLMVSSKSIFVLLLILLNVFLFFGMIYLMVSSKSIFVPLLILFLNFSYLIHNSIILRISAVQMKKKNFAHFARQQSLKDQFIKNGKSKILFTLKTK